MARSSQHNTSGNGVHMLLSTRQLHINQNGNQNGHQTDHQNGNQNANILTAFPPELLACIFSQLSSEPPSDIAACRLVSRAFKEHSSPFLLPRVIFARRLKELTKFRQVLQHPYFRLHVHELVYDGSTYAEATATDWNQYVEDCVRAPRDLEDSSWAERLRRDRVSWRDLDTFRHRNRKPKTARPNGEGYITSPLGRAKAANGHDETEVPTISHYDDAFPTGCNKTFVDYRQRFADQQWIRREGVDKNVLATAFTEFPNLRRIVSTDYRSLARQAESYDDCCRRLFGKTLEPQHAGVGGHSEISGDCLFPLLNVLAETPKARIDSLAIGPHAFEYTGEDTTELADPYHPQNPRYLDISALENVHLGPHATVAHILSQLKQLRLALCYSGHNSDEEHMRDQVRKLLKTSAPKIESLTVHMIYLFWGGVREPPKVDTDTRFDVFNSIITPLHMPYLRSLSLRRWIFTGEELKAFLSKHKNTLRDLHLLGCLCGDDETALARWGGQTLDLTGVELSGFLSVLDSRSANPYDWKAVSPGQWDQMRPTILEREVRELETVWLDGRSNWVVRQQRIEIMPESEWWKRPAPSV